MKQVVHPLVLLFCIPAAAQNLVPNPGFEELARMPSRHSNPVQCTRYWRSPTGAGTDYYHYEADRHAGTPRNIFGRQRPHGGEAYAGICIKSSYMEYLAITLRDTLEAGKTYRVEFFVSRADRSIGRINAFGAHFFDKKQYSFGEEAIIERPSLDFTTRAFNRKGRWTKLSAVYEADGTEVTLILGYFNYDPSKRCKTFSHYYIDDVTVTPLETVQDTSQTAEEVVVMPVEKKRSDFLT